jgi:hypothetical protein
MGEVNTHSACRRASASPSHMEQTHMDGGNLGVSIGSWQYARDLP